MAAGSAAALTAAGKANAMGQEMPTNVDIDRIIQIESSGRSNVTSDEGAKGLMQIMDGGALGDWNRIHKDKKYTPKDMYDPVKNREVGTWYMNDMIPKYLKAWKFPDTIKNRLIFYNAGPGNGKKILRGKMTMDQETKDYIKKYGEQG
jgi:soluble lytic murein transglycosylase-like protein